VDLSPLTAPAPQPELTFEVRRPIAASAADLWREMERPGHLVDVHPFCARNVPERWPGEGSRDAVHFHNGRVLWRNFTTWEAERGYTVVVTDARDKRLIVAWFGIDPGPDPSRCEMVIRVTDLNPLGLPRALRPLAWRAWQRPLLAYYFGAVLKGFEYRLTTGGRVRPNQFGRHPQYS
jgi:hypothetical protein